MPKAELACSAQADVQSHGPLRAIVHARSRVGGRNRALPNFAEMRFAFRTCTDLSIMSIETLLKVMFEGLANNDVDVVLGSFDELKHTCTMADLPALVSAMQSEQSDFWLRELLSGPITELGGCDCLPVLFNALSKGEIEGHDNDLFCSHLRDMARTYPISCREKLASMIATPDFKHLEMAQWLLGYCAAMALPIQKANVTFKPCL